MDRGLPGQEASLEAARELLIAISYSLPDNAAVVATDAAGDLNNLAADTVVCNGDKSEGYRFELISISSLQSPDDVAMSNAHA